MCRRVTKEESDHRAETMDINGAEILDGFVLGHFAAQYAQQLGKGFLANLLNGLIASNDQTGVQVHIIFHALVGIGVAADLDDRHAGEALRGTAAGREHHELDELKEHNLPKCDLFTAISETIDRHIHSSYRLFAGNYVACDLLMGDNRFTAEYTEEEKEHFENYMEQQIAKVDLHNKDASFLRHALLTMYANPLINYLKAAKG